MNKHENNVWYLAGPFYRYEQDVKKLAKAAGVRIIDANVTKSRKNAANPEDLPSVSLKPEYRPAKGKQPTAEELAAIEQAKRLTGGAK